MSRERIVILGGGMAALTAAFELTEAPDWQQRLELTIYQSGHRLGGKGASGRAGDRFDRIEEHGLHLFYGFYDNAFSVMRRCYEQLDRPVTAPLATLEHAFKPHSLIEFEEQRDEWQHQPLLFPRNPAPPGLRTPVPSPRALIPICERRHARLEPVAIGAYVPYLWVDLGAAVIGGREVLGFPKGQGTLGFEVNPDGRVALQLDAYLPPHDHAGVGVAWQLERVLTLRSDPATHARSSLADLLVALNGASNSQVLASAGLDPRARLRVMQLVVQTLRSGALTMVFLKQYRDAARPELACYQAVVEACVERLGPAHAERVLGDRVELQLSRRVPVIDALGLPAEGTGELARVPVLGAHYMVMDFRIGVGIAGTRASSRA